MRIKILIVFLLVMAVSFSSSYAIERVFKEQDKKEKGTTETSVKESSPKNILQEGDTNKVEIKQRIEERKERYDNFIDKNNNGIDDRLEKQKREEKVFEKEKREEKREEVQKIERNKNQEERDTSKESHPGGIRKRK
jgi:Skp family chaperone for outer membrane proteins